jgi:hypothetical protein
MQNFEDNFWATKMNLKVRDESQGERWISRWEIDYRPRWISRWEIDCPRCVVSSPVFHANEGLFTNSPYKGKGLLDQVGEWVTSALKASTWAEASFARWPKVPPDVEPYFHSRLRAAPCCTSHKYESIAVTAPCWLPLAWGGNLKAL